MNKERQAVEEDAALSGMMDGHKLGDKDPKGVVVLGVAILHNILLWF
jgi:hypothetical protein